MELMEDERMEEVNRMEELIISALGERKALKAIIKALDTDTKKDIYQYIIRMYDLDRELKEEE